MSSMTADEFAKLVELAGTKSPLPNSSRTGKKMIYSNKMRERKHNKSLWKGFIQGLEIKDSHLKKRDPNAYLIYDNQAKIAHEIVKNMSGTLNSLITSNPQVGKTGVFAKIIELIGLIYLQSVKDIGTSHTHKKSLVPLTHVFLITGMSYTSWVVQMKNRMPLSFHEQIYHRPNLSELAKKIKGMKNVLICIDESHQASNVDQTLHLFFKVLSSMSVETMEKNNIRIVQASATPNSILIDMKTWENRGKVYELDPGKGYYSPYMLHSHGKVKSYYDLRKRENCELFKTQVQKFEDQNAQVEKFKKQNGHKTQVEQGHKTQVEQGHKTQGHGHKTQVEKQNGHKIHIVRVDKQIEKNLFHVYKKEKEEGSVRFLTFYEEDDDEKKFDEIFETMPETTTILLIKEKLRCSKTILNKKHIGIVFERFTENPSSDVIRQGLLGRMCGYYRKGLPNFLIYTNTDFIYDKEDIKWNSSGLKVENAKVTSYFPTFSNKGLYENELEKLELVQCGTVKEACAFIREHYPKAKPLMTINKFQKDEQGRYQCKYGKKNEVMMLEEFLSSYTREINPRKYYKIYPVYNDEQLILFISITYPLTHE